MKKIILTGGGTAGHVIPNLALLKALQGANFDVHYIGSHNGIEREIVEAEKLPYSGISSGKLRRYLNIKNITDVFRVLKGVGDAVRVIRRVKPDIVFSKGGFVTVPVIYAARLCGVKSVIHESDITPGLANRLSMPFAAKVCCSFPETLKHVGGKGVLTGSPIRPSLYAGSKEAGLKFAGFESGLFGKPLLLVTGGSLGAAAINACVREALPEILKSFNMIHLCGKGNLSGIKLAGYAEFEYVGDAMADVLAAADIVVSRAGANTLFELLALKKPHLLIPLTKEASRGDQILNAESMKKQGFSMVLPEGDMTVEKLVAEISALYNAREDFVRTMSSSKGMNGVDEVMSVISSVIEM